MSKLLLGWLLMTLAPLAGAADDLARVTETWYAHLESPGGELPFVIELERSGTQAEPALQAFLVNGIERIPVPLTEWDGLRLALHITHYAATLTLERESEQASELRGEWRKLGSAGEYTVMAAMATRTAPSARESSAADTPFDGRWSVNFETDEQPAVGVFGTLNGRLLGTFLTTTGDYRYLAGRQRGKHFKLSVFDGAHAFLFTGSLQDDGSLSGDFWSRDSHHESFSAVRDPSASLPDGFGLTGWDADANVNALSFPDLQGTPRTLGDERFAGKARLVQIFGSWCPNCHDASDYLAELHERYVDRGLSIVGLAFEYTGDHARDAEQVKRYAERHGVQWPLLIAGTSKKSDAVKSLPFLDVLNSYPTTLFVHADGSVRAVYQGFSGPATGEAHMRLKASFEALIEELLNEDA